MNHTHTQMEIILQYKLYIDKNHPVLYIYIYIYITAKISLNQ